MFMVYLPIAPYLCYITFPWPTLQYQNQDWQREKGNSTVDSRNTIALHTHALILMLQLVLFYWFILNWFYPERCCETTEDLGFNRLISYPDLLAPRHSYHSEKVLFPRESLGEKINFTQCPPGQYPCAWVTNWGKQVPKTETLCCSSLYCRALQTNPANSWFTFFSCSSTVAAKSRHRHNLCHSKDLNAQYWKGYMEASQNK